MSKSVKLRVPFAFDGEKRLYEPETAEKGKHYFGPACLDIVILRKGEIKTAHFLEFTARKIRKRHIIGTCKISLVTQYTTVCLEEVKFS